MAVLTAVALSLAVLLSSGCGDLERRGPFRGQFLDAETGQPIEGVVFLAVWFSVTANFVSGGSEALLRVRTRRIRHPARAGYASGCPVIRCSNGHSHAAAAYAAGTVPAPGWFQPFTIGS
jgi:hypothetical protein